MIKENAKIKEVARLLKRCKSILFITGSGISADSGLPTYRGAGGLYENRATDDGIPIEMALAGETLKRRPEITWKYLSQIEERCRAASYNRAHEVLAEMERRFERVWVLTQNIDGLHYAAGSVNVIDIHGDMHKIICEDCGWRVKVEDYSRLSIPPRCPECNSVARPEVVFFGEMLPAGKVRIMEKEFGRPFSIYFSIGTTSVFPYISQPMVMARNFGKPTVEINPDSTEISGLVDIKIAGGAAEVLDAIWHEFNEVK